MATRTDHGYSVKRSNEVLQGISIYSGVDRLRAPSSYHRVRVGMKVGTNTEWLATWDQSLQAMKEGEPLSILPASRQGMRLPLGAVIVTELTTTGTPAAIRGSSVDLDLSLTGGGGGARRPLISFGQGGSSLQAVADAINRSGLAEKVARIPLDDVPADASFPIDEYTLSVEKTIGATQKTLTYGTVTLSSGALVTIASGGKWLALSEPYGT